MHDDTELATEEEAGGGIRSQRGASLVEYALLLALIAVVCVAAVSALGGTTAVPYSEVASTLG